MNDDIVARLRLWAENAKKQDATNIVVGLCAAVDEIERLRAELGQVSDADAFLSEMDAAHLDNLLNWCEFNEMDWHRALARLVADRARLRGELFPIRKELEEMRFERDAARAEVCHLRPSVLLGAQSAADYAETRGWKLYKEETQ